MTSQVRYVITREIAAGGVAGELRTISFPVVREERSLQPTRDRRAALNGATVTDLKRIETFWDIQTGLLSIASIQLEMYEFAASVMAGELFEFDPSADGFRNVELETPNFRPERDGVLSRFRYTFRFKEV